MTPTLADLANRTWSIVRREFISLGEDGRPVIVQRGWDKIDVGNYRPSDVSAHVMCGSAAREMGDDELADALQRAIDDRFDPITVDGATRYEGASTFSNMGALIGRFNRVGGWAQAVAEGPDPRVLVGPWLDDAPYPQVLVALADTDGTDLRLVLRPGAMAGRYEIGVAGLRAGETYDVLGARSPELTASAAGTARLVIDLDGRTEVQVRPRR